LLEEVHVLRCELAASHLASTRIFGYHSREVIGNPLQMTSMHIRLRQKTKNGGFATSGFHMAIFLRIFSLCLVCCLPLIITPWAVLADPSVELLRVPEGGLQPEVLLDARGELHLLYFSGEASGGDLHYTHASVPSTPDKMPDWTPPIRVNDQEGSAIAIGTVRGGHLALGAGYVHITWMSANRDDPGMYYTRSDSDDGFEPQRNVTRNEHHLDGGGSIAADDAGQVHVAWHAGLKEPTRSPWVTTSFDSGRTFTPEAQANPVETGACGCCGMRAAAESEVYILYRAATQGTQRGMQLLHNTTGQYQQIALDEWEATTCPMSTASIHPFKDGALLAWERAGQIWWSSVLTGQVARPVAVAGEGTARKHPTISRDDQGQILIAWAEGTGWARGGDLVWKLYDRDQVPISSGRMEGAIPTWSRSAAVARPGGGFYLIH